jgi:DMSO/TMAO reductase YedYZ molybdopterin-dependent catalytic subunit
LPEQEWIYRHICVEGWDYIGQWSGPSFKLFLERVEADLTAKYVAFRCADGYSSSIDMRRRCIRRRFSQPNTPASRSPIRSDFPLRLRMSTKLGFKNPKWITAIEVTDL